MGGGDWPGGRGVAFEQPLVGTVDEAVDKLGEAAQLGSIRFYLQLLDLNDRDQLELVADRVAGQFAGWAD